MSFYDPWMLKCRLNSVIYRQIEPVEGLVSKLGITTHQPFDLRDHIHLAFLPLALPRNYGL